MDLDQQFKKLMIEFEQLQEENKCLTDKYQTLLEDHKNLQIACQCKKRDIAPEGDSKENRLEPDIPELCRLVKELESKVSLLEIQLATYKEDFQMERKDREAAQDRVIGLEQKLAELCSGTCTNLSLNLSSQSAEAYGFEVWPSPSEFHYPPTAVGMAKVVPQPPVEKKTASSNEVAKQGNFKSILSNFSRKKRQPSANEKEVILGARGLCKNTSEYEYDGLQLRGRNLVEGLCCDGDEKNDDVRVDASKDSSNAQSHTTVPASPLRKVISACPASKTSADGADKLGRKRSKERRRPDSGEILRCPACSKAFEASSEHYKLLQHMDKCGQ